MDLRDLRVFLAVVECRGFTAAGKKLYMVQSGVSDAVARLERDLGLTLLDRRRDGTVPTAAGTALARWAHFLVNSAERARREVRAFSTAGPGVLNVGFLPTITTLVLPQLLGRLEQRLPQVRVHVHEGLAPALVEQVRQAALDAAVVFFPVEHHADVALVDAAALPLEVIAAAAHHLASGSAVALAELVDEGWVTYPPHNPGRLWLEHTCRLAGFEPRIAAEVETPTQQRIFVEAGIGIAMTPLATGGGWATDRAVAVPIEPPLAALRVGYVYSPHLVDPAVELARTCLDEALGSL